MKNDFTGIYPDYWKKLNKILILLEIYWNCNSQPRPSRINVRTYIGIGIERSQIDYLNATLSSQTVHEHIHTTLSQLTI